MRRESAPTEITRHFLTTRPSSVSFPTPAVVELPYARGYSAAELGLMRPATVVSSANWPNFTSGRIRTMTFSVTLSANQLIPTSLSV